MKWLAVDYGDSRTGLAGCDESETVTSPITPQIEEKSINKEQNRLFSPSSHRVAVA